MNSACFQTLTARYAQLRLAVVGDFCLDRYLEIDPARTEISIETGLPVHNVVHVRAQPGGAGTVLNNLVAVGTGEIHLAGFCGDDGEGYELRRALAAMPGVRMDHFITAPDRRTFTYCKPLVIEPGCLPRELNRLDSKNWTPTPPALAARMADAVRMLAGQVDAMIVMDQVDHAGTGVVCGALLAALADVPKPVIADSRRGLGEYPSVIFKMNATELGVLLGRMGELTMEEVPAAAAELARRNGRAVFVTMAGQGMVGVQPGERVEHVPAFPVRGAIDVVGAGDAVTANLAAALASGASVREAMELAAAAASIVIHQLGTTGTASVAQMAGVLLDALREK